MSEEEKPKKKYNCSPYSAIPWDEDVAKFVREQNGRMTPREMAKAINNERYTPDVIRAYCKFHKIPFKKLDSYSHHRKYNVNFDFFKTWSHNMAYIFGLWCADGCIFHKEETGTYIFKIFLHENDKELLKKINEEMENESPVKINKAHVASITISSKKIIEDIEKLGGMPNKSLKLDFPQGIPEEFLHDFLRGYSDGDGSVAKTGKGWNLVATLSFCQTLQKILQEKTGAETRIIYPACKTNNITARLQARRWEDWEKIYNYFYKDVDEHGSLFLPRKRLFIRPTKCFTLTEATKEEIVRRILRGDRFKDIYEECCAPYIGYPYFRHELIQKLLAQRGISNDIIYLRVERARV